MKPCKLCDLADATLLSRLDALDARDRGTTAELLAYLGEVDARKLYLPAGYPSMYAYCVGHRKYSEDVAYKRIRAARAGRRFPVVLELVESGRLHLSGVVLLAPYLTEDTVGGLVLAAENKTNAEIERMLASRFPRPDLPTRIEPIVPTTYACQLAVRPVEPAPEQETATTVSSTDAATPVPAAVLTDAMITLPMESPVAAQVGLEVPRPRLTPLAPERFALQVPIDQETHDLLRYAQALLSHVMPPSDLTAVLKRVVAEGVPRLERQRFAATEQSHRGGRRVATEGRHIPADVKRAVWKRDGGRCTFVSDKGERCPEEAWLQFDHVDPYARGGDATVSGIRLLCRAHNQYEAERAFGDEFMNRKRKRALGRAGEVRAQQTNAGALP